MAKFRVGKDMTFGLTRYGSDIPSNSYIAVPRIMPDDIVYFAYQRPKESIVAHIVAMVYVHKCQSMRGQKPADLTQDLNAIVRRKHVAQDIPETRDDIKAPVLPAKLFSFDVPRLYV